MNAKQMTAHIRSRIKAAGIKARVRFWPNGQIQVFGVTAQASFTEEEQREIRLIASVNRLTWVRGMAIDLEQMTNPHGFNFYMPE